MELVSCQPFDDFPQQSGVSRTNWIALKYGRAAEQAEKQEEYLRFPDLPSALLSGLYIGGKDRLNSKGRSYDMNGTYLRGDMYYADLGRGVGSEQEGYRPVLIIQNNTGNKYSTTVIVAAISSKVDAKAKLPTHYLLKAENGLELPSLVLLEQLRTIDKRRLEHYIGRLDEYHIRRINRALAISVGLIEEVPKNLIMCLCPACANNFYGTDSYYLRRIDRGKAEKGICTYCGQRPGFDYEIVKRNQ